MGELQFREGLPSVELIRAHRDKHGGRWAREADKWIWLAAAEDGTRLGFFGEAPPRCTSLMWRDFSPTDMGNQYAPVTAAGEPVDWPDAASAPAKSSAPVTQQPLEYRKGFPSKEAIQLHHEQSGGRWAMRGNIPARGDWVGLSIEDGRVRGHYQKLPASSVLTSWYQVDLADHDAEYAPTTTDGKPVAWPVAVMTTAAAAVATESKPPQWRTGLPTVEQVAAHEASGGRWLRKGEIRLPKHKNDGWKPSGSEMTLEYAPVDESGKAVEWPAAVLASPAPTVPAVPSTMADQQTSADYRTDVPVELVHAHQKDGGWWHVAKVGGYAQLREHAGTVRGWITSDRIRPDHLPPETDPSKWGWERGPADPRLAHGIRPVTVDGAPVAWDTLAVDYTANEGRVKVGDWVRLGEHGGAAKNWNFAMDAHVGKTARVRKVGERDDWGFQYARVDGNPWQWRVRNCVVVPAPVASATAPTQPARTPSDALPSVASTTADFRPGLPPVEAVRIHQAAGGWWLVGKRCVCLRVYDGKVRGWNVAKPDVRLLDRDPNPATWGVLYAGSPENWCPISETGAPVTWPDCAPATAASPEPEQPSPEFRIPTAAEMAAHEKNGGVWETPGGTCEFKVEGGERFVRITAKADWWNIDRGHSHWLDDCTKYRPLVDGRPIPWESLAVTLPPTALPPDLFPETFIYTGKGWRVMSTTEKEKPAQATAAPQTAASVLPGPFAAALRTAALRAPVEVAVEDLHEALVGIALRGYKASRSEQATIKKFLLDRLQGPGGQVAVAGILATGLPLVAPAFGSKAASVVDKIADEFRARAATVAAKSGIRSVLKLLGGAGTRAVSRLFAAFGAASEGKETLQLGAGVPEGLDLGVEVGAGARR